MRLEGIHHISAITGDAPANVEFYVGRLGLRMVKRTVNQDDPSVYHLFYGDEHGTPGLDMTFFEYPHAAPGRAGAGMVHTIEWRVPSAASLDFWAERLAPAGSEPERVADDRLRFHDPEGLQHELVVSDLDEPLTADAPDVPAEHRITGFHGVRAYGVAPARSTQVLRDVLGFEERGEGTWEVRGERRGGTLTWDEAPAERGRQGAGSVHHVAFATYPDEHREWADRVTRGGLRSSGIVDRTWFESIYFREPNGVLFELATLGPGFAIDEAPEHLGERLTLPAHLEPRRAQLEATLTPLPDPRARGAAA